MPESSKEPFYLIPPDHPLLEEYKPWIELYMSGILSEGTTMHLLVPDDVVQAGVISGAQEMFQVLQHYPELLEGLFLNVSIKFQIPSTDQYYDEDDWIDAAHIAWLRKLMDTTSIVVLFIQDPKAQFFGLMGDQVLKSDKLKNMPPADTKIDFKLSSEQMSILDHRLFEAFRFCLVYLHGSGVDPKESILHILKAYKIKFSYDILLEVHQDDLQQGDSFSLISPTDN